MNVVIVGGGQAGAACAAKLRSLDPEVGITLLAAEDAPPYQRPPLSKAYLMGEMVEDRLYLRPASFYDENRIELRLRTPATAIDRDARTVTAGEDAIAYDELVLATGSRPRRLPASIGGDLAGVHEVRTLRDVDGMSPAFVPGARALIVGGGYIGLEAAAVASKRGLHVTLVEAAERILGRVAAPETADYFRSLHRAHGVDIREGVGLQKLAGSDRATGAILTDGASIDLDFAIVGVGVTPDCPLAEAAGLDCYDGILVDDRGRASDRNIWAAGDCARFPYRGRRIRLESVQNAIDQAEAVAANILGADAPYLPHPWFWSDQYDVKLQIAGLNAGYDRVVVRPGVRDGSVNHWYFAGETLIAVDAMNDPRAYMTAKRLLELGRSPDPADVPQGDLKEFLR